MRWASSQMTRSHSGRRLQLGLQLLGARGHVEAHDQAVALDEGVAGERGLDLVAGEDVEGEAELLGHLVLPLLDQAARRDDQAALEVAADQQLLDQQPGHDGLAGAGIVGEQEAQRLARQHLAVDGGDLVRQRLDLRRADGEVGVEQVGEPDAVGLRRQPQQGRRRRRRRRPARPRSARSRPRRRGRPAARRPGRRRGRRGSRRPRRSARPARPRRPRPGRVPVAARRA